MKCLHKVYFLFLTVVVILNGCSMRSEVVELTQNTSTNIPQTEIINLPTVVEPTLEFNSELSVDCDKTKLCLRFQPTQEVTAGEDVRYYAPSNQSEWISVFEDTLAKADPNEHWEPADSSMGIWICYQDHWWELLASGDVLTIGSGRIAANDASQIYKMCMDTAKNLHMGDPVRPEQIKNIKSATLDWGGIYTITDFGKLQILEEWLSSSTEVHGGANCWFAALLTLTLENGDVLTLSMATDTCCTWMSEGVFYDYGAFDNAELFALFTGDAT